MILKVGFGSISGFRAKTAKDPRYGPPRQHKETKQLPRLVLNRNLAETAWISLTYQKNIPCGTPLHHKQKIRWATSSRVREMSAGSTRARCRNAAASSSQ